ncbi:MAG TPA: DUF2269 family protein [Solirubrobacteraceae bacterium]|jgi:hypothetical protein|nr:DUF2269 family protein [Solirubrobacteraceae bacterium]
MPGAPLAALSEYVLAVHIMAVVAGFGVVFAYPIMFAVAARQDPGSLPLIHRIEHTIERVLINPGLLLVVIAGIYLASDGHRWSEFFVQWGLGAAIVIGALVGAVMIPTAKRAEQLAARDVAASGEGPVQMSEDYRALTRRLSGVGTLLSLIVVLTVLFMVVKP